jgi:23S rRNA pseudouridine1911/1915/1917 synthase
VAQRYTSEVRLDVALVRLHPGLSRRKAQDVIAKGQVTVDGALAREPGLSVAPGSVLDWDPNRKALPRARLRLPALHEDDHVLVVDKPAGLLAVPTDPEAHDEDTALRRVRDYARRLRPRRPYVGLVHRIDRDTSGALVFALSPEARSGLIDAFRDHRIERRYVALVAGVPGPDEGRVDAPLREAYVSGRRGVARGGEPARPARTRWRVLERFPRAALLEVELETGRQHQVRVHLAHVGLPVLGDAVYGGKAPSPVRMPRQMLHARTIAFAHPITGEPVRVESPLPEDFAQALEGLRKRASKGPPRGGV